MPSPVAGLQGGTAPARAFHDFMSVAVANRPVEQFETQVPMPDWQLTPEEEVYGDSALDANGMAPMVDENGMPIGTPPRRSGLSAAAADGPARRHRRARASRSSTRPSRRSSSAAASNRQPRQPQPQPRRSRRRQPIRSAPADPPQPRPDAA